MSCHFLGAGTIVLCASGTYAGAIALSVVLMSPGAVSLAQAAEDDSSQINEIIVTARKREENLQNVPVSVVAITANELQMRSIDSLASVGQSTPNLTFGQQVQGGSSGNVVFIRGVGQSDVLATYDPAVGIYIDGVYLGRMSGNDLDMMDIERVEVLRGPQGTLFGKNTNGGAISIVTKKPDLTADAPEGRIQLIGGSHDRADVVAGLNLPIAKDVVALDVNVARRFQDGYSNRIDGQQQANKDRYDGRVALLVKPSEHFEALWSIDGTTYNQDNAAFKLVATRNSAIPQAYAAFTPFRYNDQWVTRSPYYSDATGPNVDDGRLWGTALTLTWNQDWGTFKSISSYRRSKIANDFDADGSPLSLLDSYEGIHQHQFSQELQATGTGLGDRLNWVTGLYYFNEHVQDDTFYGVALEIFHGAASFTQNLDVNNKSYAVYGQGTYDITDKLKFTLGARGTYEQKDVGRFQTGQEYVATSGDWSNFLPRIGFDYHWTPHLMTYVSAAEGTKSGGFNGRAGSVAEFNRFEPEKVWTYELGLRSDWFDRRLRFNATAFYSVYTDLQIQTSASVTDPTTGQPVVETFVGNIPRSIITGGELELTVVPLEGLQLIGNLGIADGQYKTLLPGAPVTRSDEFVDTPKTSFTVAAQYSTQLTQRYELAGRIDYTHKSWVEYDYSNSPLVAQKPYGLLDAKLTLNIQGTGLSFSVVGTNLTNTVYAVGGHDDGPAGSLGFVLDQLGPPREWGASLEYRF
jgi:iron complex outermembrane receptor protein